ncbi:MAG: tRNA (adenosine(37)-N6)-threonylcarbamoyltransferase complex ATPase subunit type 1 TsaE [Patescibacteria group bacterium]
MNPNIVNTQSLKETQEFASNFAKNLKAGDILCLYGDLGSGKTSFVQGLAKGLGIEGRIISPTFIIARQYEMGNLNFYHIDLYRTQTMHDLYSIGLDEILENKNNIVAIEWSEKLLELLPKKRIDLKFEYIDQDKRKIIIETYE